MTAKLIDGKAIAQEVRAEWKVRADALKARGITMEQARLDRMSTIPARRYGTAAEFGATCAFLCSQHAGFIVGQNILLDGGSFNSTL